MFKNKFLIIALAVALVGIMFYSLNTSKPYSELAKAERDSYKSNLLGMKDSPLTAEKADHLHYFEVAENWIVQADWAPASEARQFAIQMTDSTSETMPLAGTATFKLQGKTHTLMLFDEGETLLLPFKDATNGGETYGGGRYINVPKTAVSGSTIELDFNQSHNFYCAYSERFICPIPPAENTLKVAVEAGEKAPHD